MFLHGSKPDAATGFVLLFLIILIAIIGIYESHKETKRLEFENACLMNSLKYLKEFNEYCLKQLHDEFEVMHQLYAELNAKAETYLEDK